jgi:hypothetical protein
LALSPEGVVKFVVLGHGGVAGVGQTYTAAPFDALDVRLDEAKWAVYLEMATDDLKKAPTITSEDYRELTDQQWVARADQFFTARNKSANKPKTGDGSAARECQAVEHVILASKLCGAKPKNTQNEELGKIEDLLLDRSYRVAFVILGRGGVVGIGESYVPVPWSKLSLSKSKENNEILVTLDATKGHLEKAPVVKGDDYATLLGRGFADEVRRYFGVTERGEAVSGAERR